MNEEWPESRDDRLGHGTFDKFHPTETSLELSNLFLYLPVWLSKEKIIRIMKSDTTQPVK